MDEFIPNNTLNNSCWELDEKVFCGTKEEMIVRIEEYLKPSVIEIILMTLHSIVFIVGLIGNFLVCYAVFRCKALQTLTCFFIVNLALADFIVLLICLPPTVLQTIYETWYFGSTMCNIIIPLQTVSVASSELTLCAISVERYFGICRPLRPKMPISKFILILVVIWIISILVTLPTIIHMNFSYKFHDIHEYLSFCYMNWSLQSDVIYNNFLIICLYCVPLVIIGVCYIVISRELWSNKIPRITTESPELAASQLQSRRNIAKMLIAIVILFAVCYLPSHVIYTLHIYGKLDLVDKSLFKSIWMVCQWLTYFNSAINPVIYNFMSEKFRTEFRRACICKRERRNSFSHTYMYKTVTYQGDKA